ncbi:hypothetical protein ANO11243_016860 [Dothideomycetidae sp. 11243]|nr:hypothetical protein ANO11243_016860 [fungal sp. No.11243]
MSPNSVWASDRLVYRATEQEDMDMVMEIYSDPEDLALNGDILLCPIQIDPTWLATMQAQTLSATICLPGKTTDTTAGSAATETDNDGLTPIGYIVVVAMDEQSQVTRSSSIGLSILKEYRNQGYGSEAILWALNWAFRHANIHRMEMGVYEYNRAQELYKRLGFVPEVRLRNDIWYKGRFWDRITLGMLKDEWRQKYGGTAGNGAVSESK